MSSPIGRACKQVEIVASWHLCAFALVQLHFSGRLVRPTLRGALLGLEIGTSQSTLPVVAGRFGRTPHIVLSGAFWALRASDCNGWRRRWASRDNGATGTQEEPAVFRGKLRAWRVLHYTGRVRRKDRSLSGTCVTETQAAWRRKQLVRCLTHHYSCLFRHLPQSLWDSTGVITARVLEWACGAGRFATPGQSPTRSSCSGCSRDHSEFRIPQ